MSENAWVMIYHWFTTDTGGLKRDDFKCTEKSFCSLVSHCLLGDYTHSVLMRPTSQRKPLEHFPRNTHEQAVSVPHDLPLEHFQEDQLLTQTYTKKHTLIYKHCKTAFFNFLPCRLIFFAICYSTVHSQGLSDKNIDSVLILL